MKIQKRKKQTHNIIYFSTMYHLFLNILFEKNTFDLPMILFVLKLPESRIRRNDLDPDPKHWFKNNEN